MDSREVSKLAACILLYSLRAVRELTATTLLIKSSSPSILSLAISILERDSCNFFVASVSFPEEPFKSIEICSSMASMASSISSMASSQSMASADFRLSCAAFKVRLLAFTRGPIWSKERVPSEGMVTEVLPVEDWGCLLSLGARTAAAGADRDSRAEQVRHRAAKRFFIGDSSWRGKGNRLLETGRKCCYFSRVL